MAKLRKFCAYKRLERPYTRVSKFRAKSFVRARPHSKVVRYNMGDQHKNYDVTMHLVSKQSLQIRSNSIESSRLACNRVLEKEVGKMQYFFTIRIYPHHILRENPLASGAGADRMSTGMKKSFGKAIGVAAQIREGQELATVKVTKNMEVVARKALKKLSMKLPCKTSIVLG